MLTYLTKTQLSHPANEVGKNNITKCQLGKIGMQEIYEKMCLKICVKKCKVVFLFPVSCENKFFFLFSPVQR